MKVLTRDQQRKKSERKQMASVHLYAHLSNLIREILAGDTTKLPEFQEMIQYAPAEMKVQMMNRLERHRNVYTEAELKQMEEDGPNKDSLHPEGL